MEAFLVSLGAVAVAEIGDKTQLLALLLAMRFRAPLAVISGIFVATVANHALAAWAGTLVADWLDPEVLAWIVGASFLSMGLWVLVPDAPPSEEEAVPASRYGAFAATLVAFFIVEMGDKTQLATVALGAHYGSLVLVAFGTTLGMMAANVPVVLFGEAAANRIPLSVIRVAAAAIFILLGVAGIASALSYAS